MKKQVSLLLTFILLVSIMTACGTKKPETAKKENSVEVKKVVVSTVKSKKMIKLSELSGTLKPDQEAMVSFEVPGRIISLNKSEGDKIKTGDILAVLDGEDYILRSDQAKANVKQADAGLRQVIKGAREQEITQAQAMVDKAKAAQQKALDDFNRVKQLFSEGAVSQSDYEGAQTRLTVADKDLLSAQQGYSMVVEGATAEVRDRTQAVYDLAVVSKEQADLAVAKTRLRSPVTGTVIAKLSSDGQLVQGGIPIYRIGNIDTLKVVLPVPDHEISAWKKGDTVSLSLYGKTRAGEVSSIFPATNQSTGTIGVEVRVANPEHDWYSGQVVKATRQLESAETFYVPVEAVVSKGEGQRYLFIIKDKKAVKTKVKIGNMIDNQLEIIQGLHKGSLIVIKGADRLFDGETVSYGVTKHD